MKHIKMKFDIIEHFCITNFICVTSTMMKTRFCFLFVLFVLGNSAKVYRRKPFLSALLPQDCQDILWSGTRDNGVYTIYPRGTGGFSVYCDMKTAGGGWTVFQKRKDGRVNFNRNWVDYKYGFGNIGGEYWLGNRRIHQLTSQGWYMLRVDMSDFAGKTRYAEYRVFSVGNQSSRFKITVDEYRGNAGFCLPTLHSGNIKEHQSEGQHTTSDNIEKQKVDIARENLEVSKRFVIEEQRLALDQ